MRSRRFAFRKEAMLLGLGVAAGLFFTQGCKSSTEGTPDQQAEFRKAINKKGFDINEVPAKDRERVRALMQANGQGGGPSAPK